MAVEIKRYYRKHVDFFDLLQKVKLWPSRNGTLHGIKKMQIKGDYAEITTHCNEKFIVKRSKNSHSARWLRNKWYRQTCKKCRIPDWKLEKYSTTCFNQNFGKDLSRKNYNGI
ncbi:pyrrolysine--tRNA(Pyl) ligase small subunit [Dethiosulfatibacter aminovorans]|uniref:pyrrolysine--tRNA(Pyl) ligase small subunit n=1 Tax=Dethiosulfatibacter aminovorans TaxID=332095 RepID=UPI000933EF37|nr:pyrrolysine--tRNA(Pyl) ligase small subunit [Dethiosulfatibacter aminovorans]